MYETSWKTYYYNADGDVIDVSEDFYQKSTALSVAKEGVSDTEDHVTAYTEVAKVTTRALCRITPKFSISVTKIK